MKIVIVGPCASGTSTLADRLRAASFDAHPSAQEHSYVPDMWRMTNPDLLIYLDATMETIRRRRDVSWDDQHLARERARLRHARQHCDLYIPTDNLTVDEVFERARQFIESRAEAARH